MSDEPRLPATIEKSIKIPPALVEACAEDPELLTKLSRSQLAVVQDLMVRRLIDNPETSLALHATVHAQLSKNANINAKDEAAAQRGAQVVINFHRHGKDETVVIESKAEPVDDGV